MGLEPFPTFYTFNHKLGSLNTLLQQTSQHLGWPTPAQVLRPTGGGPSQHARVVEQKIGNALARRFGLHGVTTGVLAADPLSDTSDAPIAVVCQFDVHVTDDVLRETHRLCWNLSHASLLVTLEPTRIQAWTCSMAPRKSRQLDRYRVGQPIEFQPDFAASVLQSEAAQVLHWVNLVSGAFLQTNQQYFRKEERVDSLLVSNLRAVRQQLLGAQLGRDICHALLARLIFTQFLFQRTDSDGRPAISQAMLDGRFDGHLRKQYQHETALAEILRDKEETYRLFRWLNEKFNGDLFPGKGRTEDEREEEWRSEKKKVQPEHLGQLADFVSGRINLKNGQQSFWPEYSFDTIPLEFISSVYEEFLNEDQLKLSAYYTPPHLVDFVLDGLLPWGGKDWNVRILDPCCGSGIFLVKAFQRLVQSWRNAHPEEEPRIDELRGLLEENLMGVDASEDAIRVASFSLCLALCDAIDPRHYWKRTLFPNLRNVRLIESDFFAENNEAFRTPAPGEPRQWDLVIGNAPWRGGAVEDDALAVKWAGAHHWPVVDKNPGPLFLAKGAAITKPTGRVAMIQPAATLFYQRHWAGSDRLRQKLLAECTIEEVVSFVHLRWQLFKNAKSPACLVTFRPTPSTPTHVFHYVCPKPLGSSQDDVVISIERQDVHEISVEEALEFPTIWTVLLLGSRRDVSLVRTLSRHATMRKLKASSVAKATGGQCLLTREGIIRGSTKQRDEPQIVGRRILENPNFPDPETLTLEGSQLPINRNAKVDHRASSDFSAFAVPQLLIKQSILKSVGRFQAQLVVSKKADGGVICSQSYVSVHQFKDGDQWLRAACLALRSQVSAYYLALTSRLAFDRGEALSSDMLDVPLPNPSAAILASDLAEENVDDAVERAFGLKESERALVSDLLEFVYREGGRSDNDRPGRSYTERKAPGQPGDVQTYADFFLRALRATFGGERAVRATVFDESPINNRLPVRMVAIHLDWKDDTGPSVITEAISTTELRRELGKFYHDQLNVRNRQGIPVSVGIGFQRVARLFLSHKTPAGIAIPTALILKPDERRYWTRSQALRDADELAASIMSCGQRRRATG